MKLVFDHNIGFKYKSNTYFMWHCKLTNVTSKCDSCRLRSLLLGQMFLQHSSHNEDAIQGSFSWHKKTKRHLINLSNKTNFKLNRSNRVIPVTGEVLTAACATVSFIDEMSLAESPVTLCNSTSDVVKMLPYSRSLPEKGVFVLAISTWLGC